MTSTYLPVWDTGVLTSVTPDSFELRREDNNTARYKVAGPATFIFDQAHPLLPTATDWQRVAIARLRAAVEQRVTVGLYVDLASGDPGMAFWKDETLLTVLPYSLSWMAPGALDDDGREERLRRLVRGVALAPTTRHRFGRAIRTPRLFPRWLADASRWHLRQLVSQPRAQEDVLQSKLTWIDQGRHLSGLEQWAASDLEHGLGVCPAAIAERLGRVFDVPGFVEGDGAIPFTALMPAADSDRSDVDGGSR